MDGKPDSAQPLAAPGTSEPRRAEDELRESEERFRDVIEHAPIGMALTSPDGRFIRVNRALCDIVGYTAEELLKLTFEDITHPDDRQKDLDQVKRLESGKIPAYEMEKRYVRKNGEVVWVQITGSLLRDAQGHPLQLIKQVQNITERKRVEEKLRAASHYARSLIEASLDPLVTISNEGIITDVNAASELATGIAREDLIGTDFASYFTDPEKAREGYLKVFSDNLVKDYPLAIRHVSGKVMDVLYNAAVYRNESGEVQGAFAAARDITERKRLEEALRRLNQNLEQRVEEEVAKNREKDHILIQQSRLAAMGEMVHNIATSGGSP